MTLSIIPVDGIREVEAGDRLGRLLLETGVELKAHDVVVVASKAVAKAEGRVVRIETSYADIVRSESVRVLRKRDNLQITETLHGFVCANSGVDRSNVAPGFAVLLPIDPDNSAHNIRNEVRGLSGLDIAVIVSDTSGRAWRNGVTDVALGCAGIKPIDDLRGQSDAHGNSLDITQICVVDEIAGAAAMVMGKSAQVPMAIVRGIDASLLGTGSIASDVVRRPKDDLFR